MKIPYLWGKFLGKEHRPRIDGQPNTMRVVMPVKTYLKMKYYIKHASGEVGGIGVVTKKDTTLIIDDVFLLKQKATGGHFELDGGELARFVAELSKTRPELLPKLKLWWHSHVNMGVFWSGEDDDTFERLLKHNGEMDYFVGLVGNKKLEIRARCDVESNIGVIQFDNLATKININDDDIESKMKQEVKSKVKQGYYGALSGDNDTTWLGV